MNRDRDMSKKEKAFRQFSFISMLEEERRDRWDKINTKFETNDSPAGKKLTATGCGQRFDNPRDEERMTPKESTKRNFESTSKEEWLETQRIQSIEPWMTLDEIEAILNPQEKLPWE